tara:strand:- start:213 stop:608 length:396 start_codon:yes stop_codon:yes gene_type:complete
MDYLIKLSLTLGIFFSISTHSFAEDQITETDSKVCVITLKGKKQTVESEIEKYSCVKGDVLYLMEAQVIGVSQHTAPMNAARVCDQGANIKIFALQYNIAASCVYSGKILPIIGQKSTLKLGDLSPPKKKK